MLLYNLSFLRIFRTISRSWHSGLHLYCSTVELRAPTPTVGTPKPAKNETADDDEPPLNEDDDDEEEEEYERGEEEPTTQHLVLAQFDKVCGIFLTFMLVFL